MKKRIFQNMDDGVFRIVINTEDWSEGDLDLVFELGEPEVNVGGDVPYVLDGASEVKHFGDEFVRVVHGFPYTRGFDSRDYSSMDEAVIVGLAWKDKVLGAIDAAVVSMRERAHPIATEEVFEI